MAENPIQVRIDQTKTKAENREAFLEAIAPQIPDVELVADSVPVTKALQCIDILSREDGA